MSEMSEKNIIDTLDAVANEPMSIQVKPEDQKMCQELLIALANIGSEISKSYMAAHMAEKQRLEAEKNCKELAEQLLKVDQAFMARVEAIAKDYGLEAKDWTLNTGTLTFNRR